MCRRHVINGDQWIFSVWFVIAIMYSLCLDTGNGRELTTAIFRMLRRHFRPTATLRWPVAVPRRATRYPTLIKDHTVDAFESSSARFSRFYPDGLCRSFTVGYPEFCKFNRPAGRLLNFERASGITVRPPSLRRRGLRDTGGSATSRRCRVRCTWRTWMIAGNARSYPRGSRTRLL